MKINKSKRQLAQLLIEVGVTKFPDGANWAAQDKSGKEIYCYKNKPRRPLSWRAWHHDGGVVSNGEFQANALIANWHQTVLSSDEFDQIVAETSQDVDGWIEWSGGECPVGEGDRIDVKFSDGDEFFDVSSPWSWGADAGGCNIIAYRLHKSEQAKPELCESVVRSIPEPDEQVWTNPPSIEQLAADYRNAKDYAERKQQEADAAKADADAKMKSLELAGEALGLLVSPITEKQEPELVIADWRDLQTGDLVWVEEECGRVAESEYEVLEVEVPDYDGKRTIRIRGGEGGQFWINYENGWRFIRRP